MTDTMVGMPDPEPPRRLAHWLAYTVNGYTTATNRLTFTGAAPTTTLVIYTLCVPRRGEPTT